MKLLALAPAHRLHREQLIAALWPGRQPEAAANNLHQALHVARRQLGAAALELQDDAIALSAWIDADAFRAAATAALRDGDPAAGRAAAALYSGPLLPEDLYEEWTEPARRELEGLHEAVVALADTGESAGGAGRRGASVAGGGAARGDELPSEPTAFIGREAELAEIAALLRRGPLLTLAGPAGAGKTRVAVEAAARQRARFRDGVRLVELAPLADPELIPHAVAAAIGVRIAAVEDLPNVLAERDLLILLDNCEHLIEGCAALAASIIRACPQVQLLATSREPLAIAGEVVYRMPSLSLPRPGKESESEAVRLFVDRARAAQPDFALSAANAADVARICHRLDGMPLAIELAAARVGSLPAGQLGEAFRALRFQRRTPTTRQQTLEAALDWSYRLLEPQEAALLTRLSVFAGTFDADAVDGVVGDAKTLERLVAKSLVVAHDGRFRLLELVRQFARERLQDAPELQERHARWFRALAERAEPPALDREQGNLRAALAWLLDHDPESALQLAAALGDWWLLRGRLAEGRRWLEAAVARTPGATQEVATALMRAVPLAVRAGDMRAGGRLAERSLGIYQELGDQTGVAAALTMLGLHDWVRGEQAGARAWLERAAGALDAEHALALVAIATGELERARAHLEGVLTRLAEAPARILVLGPPPLPHAGFVVMEESQIMFRYVDASLGAAHVSANLAVVARLEGDPVQAASLLRDALARTRARGDAAGVAHVLAGLGRLATLEGDATRAAEALEESLAMRRRLGDVRAIGLTLGLLAELAVQTDHRGRARTLLDRALRLVEQVGDRPPRQFLLLALARIEPPADAQKRLEAALATADELGARGVRGWTLAAMADLDPRPDRAKALLDEARKEFTHCGDRWGLEALSQR